MFRVVRWISCRGCNLELKRPLNCGHCGLLQRHCDISHNYFELFGLPVTYKLDLSRLAATKKQLQFDIHPDKWANSQSKEQAVMLSTLVNVAAECLKDPIKRAEYILRMRGHTDQTSLPPQFLQEVLELEQKIQDSEGSQKEQLLKQVAERVQVEQGRIDSAFSSQDWKGMALHLTVLRYLLRLGQTRG